MSGSSWNFTIDDTSPFIMYSPYGDGFGLENGWQPYYTESGFTNKLASPGQGQSFHITSLDNASFELDFYGTGISLFGNANCSYSIAIDGDTQSDVSPQTLNSSDHLLFGSSSLSADRHKLQLTVMISDSSQQLAFDSALITIPESNASSDTQPYFFDNSNTTAISYNGNWTTGQGQGIPNSTVEAPFHETTQHLASYSFRFSGGEAVAIYGLAYYGNWLYNVSVDGQQQQRNSSSFFQVPDALLFFAAGLDPTTSHNVSVTSIAADTIYKMTLNSVQVYGADVTMLGSPLSTSTTISPSPSSQAPTTSSTGSSRSSNANHVGPIAGVIVAVLVFLFSAFAVLLWLYRRQKMQRQRNLSPYPLPSTPPTDMVQTALPSSEATILASSPSSKKGRYTQPLPSIPFNAAANGGSASFAPSSDIASSSSRPLSSNLDYPSSSEGINPYLNVDVLVQLIAQRIDHRRQGDDFDRPGALPPDYDTVPQSVEP